MNWYKYAQSPLVPQDYVKYFNAIAYQQRSEPEQIMIKIQNSQISQLYGYICEHTGDLTHRMTEAIGYGYDGYNEVNEKVSKLLKIFSIYDLQEEIYNQIEKNIKFRKSREEKTYESVGEALNVLQQLGKEYADAHAKLPTFNEAQKTAQEAAVSLGSFHFITTQNKLEKLKDHLSSRQLWQEYASDLGDLK